MGLLLSGLGSIILAIGVVIVSAIMVAIFIAVFLGIAALIVGGSTVAPAFVFALLFTMGKSEHLIISVLIFIVSFYLIKKLIQYKKVENAIMVHLAVVASTISTYSVKMVLSFLFDRTPALILLVLMVGVMLFMLSPVLSSDQQKGKNGYPIITRVLASFLYGSSASTLLGSVVIVFGLKASGVITVICYILWAITSVLTYILDIKMYENKDYLKNIDEIPINKTVKAYYDKLMKYILNKLESIKNDYCTPEK